MCYIAAMATTTIRLEDALKDRLALAARIEGKSPHAFILDAVTETIARVEHDNELTQVAEERWGKVKSTGKTIPLDAAKQYLEARARGETVRRPAARKLSR
jgi:predicted transcriptional regulator